MLREATEPGNALSPEQIQCRPPQEHRCNGKASVTIKGCSQARERTGIFKHKWTKLQKWQRSHCCLSECKPQTNPPWFNMKFLAWPQHSPWCAFYTSVRQHCLLTVCVRCRDFSSCLMTLRQHCLFLGLLAGLTMVFLDLALGSCPLLDFGWWEWPGHRKGHCCSWPWMDPGLWSLPDDTVAYPRVIKSEKPHQVIHFQSPDCPVTYLIVLSKAQVRRIVIKLLTGLFLRKSLACPGNF